jgi:hypothetical protein
MEKIKVQLQPDHLQRLSGRRTPVASLSELIWNGLDADASTVSVKFVNNALGGLEEIHICDDGHGFDLTAAKTSFANLGSSWKKTQRISGSGRKLHGSAGEGRFAAFAIGSNILWRSYYSQDNVIKGLEIQGYHERLGEFEIRKIDVLLNITSPRTEVIITNIHSSADRLGLELNRLRLSEIFALYLRGYKAEIVHDGQRIDPNEAGVP